jgi:tetratricopeptide (TPR) repeat protein
MMGFNFVTSLRRAFSLLSLLLCVNATSAAFAPPSARIPAPTTTQASAALLQGHVDDAASILNSILSANPNDALAHQLLCRVYYAQDMADKAIQHCQLATADAPDSSDNHLWLGRSYGMKASNAGPVSGFTLARKVRDEFERAVQLDPAAPRAASDLCQYYIDAPAIVGGGYDKAQALIARIEPQFPVYSHRLRGMLAEKKKDFATAEAEFKKAITAGGSSPAWIDLAAFYQRRNQADQAVAAIQSGLANSPNGPVLVDAASILTALHRSPELADRLLRTYLASPGRTDEAPAFKVHLQLGDLLASRGNKADARAEYTAALALASSWLPARTAMQAGQSV